jgi:uncharacterized protein (TIGR02271 family)
MVLMCPVYARRCRVTAGYAFIRGGGMTTQDVRPEQIIGSTLIDQSGSKVGRVGALFLDDQTGQPEWVTVNTGLFGASESFVPITDASFDGDHLTVAFSKDHIKEAPNVNPDSDGHLSEPEEDRLYEYYGYSSAAMTPSTGNASSDDAMTRSEQRLSVDKERKTTGTARIRKWVETENVTVNVPVTRERAKLVTEPITDANRDQAMSGPDISSAEHEVTLTEERPVVGKETVPVERVRLEKEVETNEETISEEVAKERVDAEGDVINVNDPTKTRTT